MISFSPNRGGGGRKTRRVNDGLRFQTLLEGPVRPKNKATVAIPLCGGWTSFNGDPRRLPAAGPLDVFLQSMPAATFFGNLASYRHFRPPIIVSSALSICREAHETGGVFKASTGRHEGRAMLVLSRRKGEQIVIGHDVTVVVLRISGGKVALGIAAPEKVSVKRKELLTRGRHRPAPAPLGGKVRQRRLSAPSRRRAMPQKRR